MKRYKLLIPFLFFTIMVNAQEQPISYTQADRDRMVRVETQVETIQSQINRLEDKFNSYFMWGFGLVLMSIFGLMGFIIYDRRTTLVERSLISIA